MNQVFDWLQQIQRQMVHLDREHWIIILVVAFVIGLFFLRGYGSRTSY